MTETIKLSNKQAEALIKLRDHGPRSAYPDLSMGTLNSLQTRGLAKASYGLGAMAMPHTSVQWTITTKGREALTP